MPRPSLSTQPRPLPSPASRPTLRRFPVPPLPEASPLKAQLERILGSRTFSGAHRSQLFLRYILHHAVAHPHEQLKEYSIAIDVFERDESYDPAVNNTVRVEAGRLRSRLFEYYAGEGHADPLRIEVPKGSYRVLIHPRQPVTARAPLSPQSHAAKPLRSLTPSRPLLWALPLAFLIGAFVGYRASH
ncbi:MAG TPA: hypothetical protein VN734_09560 [Acidobacteriaceae bacterium]|nr:hypothetical protein [Acidobacteriaceae bacterium]